MCGRIKTKQNKMADLGDLGGGGGEENSARDLKHIASNHHPDPGKARSGLSFSVQPVVP